MTICIAAMADSGKSLFLIADTALYLNNQAPAHFEAGAFKMRKLRRRVFALLAGRSSDGMAVSDSAAGSVTDKSSVQEILEAVRSPYQERRTKEATQRFLEPLGLSMEQFVRNQATLTPALVQDLSTRLVDFNLGVDIIVAGVTRDGAFIHRVDNPGLTFDHSAVGLAAIGSGDSLALAALSTLGYSKDLPLDRVESMVRRAKLMSQPNEWVGAGTASLRIPEQDDPIVDPAPVSPIVGAEVRANEPVS